MLTTLLLMLISACLQTNAVIISRWHIFVNKNIKQIFPSGYFLPRPHRICPAKLSKQKTQRSRDLYSPPRCVLLYYERFTKLNRQEKYFVGVCLEFKCGLCIAVGKDIVALESFHTNDSVFVSANFFVCPPLALDHFF